MKKPAGWERGVKMASILIKDTTIKKVYFVTLYNIFSELLEDFSEDVLPNDFELIIFLVVR